MTRTVWFIAGAMWAVLAACDGKDRQAPGSASDTMADTGSVTTAPSKGLPALQGITHVLPVDEATRDASLTATRDSLLSITRRRDTTALARFLDPDVKYSFGDSDGRRGFFTYWKTYHSLDAMWSTIEDVLTHGGRFTGSELFAAPWTFTALPDSLDAFEHLVVRDTAVVVRSAPQQHSDAIGTLSYTIVRAGTDRVDSAWRHIVLPDGRSGYIDANRIRSPVDYRIGLGKRGSRWFVQYFVAGD